MLLRTSFVQQGENRGGPPPQTDGAARQEPAGLLFPDVAHHFPAQKPPLRSERRFFSFPSQLARGCSARRVMRSSVGSSSENTTAFAAQMASRSGSVPKTNTGE